MVQQDFVAQEPYQPPRGFRTVFDAFYEFQKRRVHSQEPEARKKQYADAEFAIDTALTSGILVVFVLTADGREVNVPANWWFRPQNRKTLRHTPACPSNPATFTVDGDEIKGIPLIDRTNFSRFCHFIDWPLPDLPPFVRMLVNIAGEKNEMDHDWPMQKADLIMLFRRHWPAELEEFWPSNKRLADEINRKDECSVLISDLAEMFASPHVFKGGRMPNKVLQAVTNRRKYRDPCGEKIASDDTLTVIDDDPPAKDNRKPSVAARPASTPKRRPYKRRRRDTSSNTGS